MAELQVKPSEDHGPLESLYNVPRFFGTITLILCMGDAAVSAITGHPTREITRAATEGLMFYGGSELAGQFLRGIDYATYRLDRKNKVE